MKLTQDHLRYWQAKKAQPSWAKDVPMPRGSMWAPPPIHWLINLQTGTTRVDLRPDASSLIAILRLIRKRGISLLPELQRIAANPGTVINPDRRAAYARKWAQRIEQSTKESA